MQFTHFKFLWLIPLAWASLGAFTNVNAMALDCSTTYTPGTAIGMPCNVYNTTSVNSTLGTCVNDRVCKPNSLSNCNGQCLYDASYASTDNPASDSSCNVLGDPGFCNCGGAITASGFPLASCNILSPPACRSSSTLVAPPSNGHLDCVWHSGVRQYVCGWSGGCALTPTTASSTLTEPQNSPGQKCNTTPDPGIMEDTVRGCFTAETAIDVESGRVPISKIKVGQRVWSFDFENNKLAKGVVTKVFFHPQRNYRILKLKDGTTLKVTSNHPIYDSSQDRFVPVSELTASSILISKASHDFNTSFLLSNDDFGLVDDVYNIEVSPYHNYFAEGILVHNKTVSDRSSHAAVLHSSYNDYLSSCTLACDAGFTADASGNCVGGGGGGGGGSCATGSIIVNGACTCPYNYEAVPISGMIQKGCRPKLPSAEFTRAPTGYPVCGSTTNPQNARLPVSYGFEIADVAGHSEPKTNASVKTTLPQNGFDYPYSKLDDINGTKFPNYIYSSAPHCACANHTVANTPLLPRVSKSMGAFSGDTLDFIESVSAGGTPNKVYGMVSIALDGRSDGRNGGAFHPNSGSSTSVCACPNLNEVPDSSSSLFGGAGPTCKPAVNPAHRIFASFDPNDLNSASEVMNKAQSPSRYSEALDATGKVVSVIQLPNSQSSPSVLSPYSRHIWKCQIGYKINLSTGDCVLGNDHQCNASSSVAAQGGISWNTVINKKLACCLNSHALGTSSVDIKFDCVENSNSLNTSFNLLWASSDSLSDGGQLNALLLTAGANGLKKAVTGFYTQQGVRCDEFSEFSAQPIQPGIVNPALLSGQQNKAQGTLGWQAMGTAIPIPASSSAAYAAVLQSLGSKAKAPDPSQGVSGIKDARRCPLLVRAAIEVSCPTVTQSTNAPQYTFVDSVTGAKKCPVASSIRVHIRAEQVFQIAGEAPLVAVDTVLDRKAASDISVGQLIRQKNGGKCLPGMLNGSSGCHY